MAFKQAICLINSLLLAEPNYYHSTCNFVMSYVDDLSDLKYRTVLIWKSLDKTFILADFIGAILAMAFELDMSMKL